MSICKGAMINLGAIYFPGGIFDLGLGGVLITTLRLLTPPMETPDLCNDTPGASIKVFLTPLDIPRSLRVGFLVAEISIDKVLTSPRPPGIQSYSQMMIGVSNHLLSIVYSFHYHSQKVSQDP